MLTPHKYHYLNWTLLLLVMACSCHTEADESQCTKSYKGAASTDFDKKSQPIAYDSESEDGPHWVIVRPDEDGPLQTDYRPPGRQQESGGYAYLQSPQKATSSISTALSMSVAKICTMFRYATTAPTDIDINVHIEGKRHVLYTLKANATNRQWEWFGVSCCLGNPELSGRTIGFTSTIGPDELVALDYIEMRVSERVCDDSNSNRCFLVSPPPPPPTTQMTTTERITYKTSESSTSEDMKGTQPNAPKTLKTKTTPGMLTTKIVTTEATESTTVMPTTKIVTTEATESTTVMPTTNIVTTEATDSTTVMPTTELVTTEATESTTVMPTTELVTTEATESTTVMPTTELVTTEATESTTVMPTTELVTTEATESTTVMPTTKIVTTEATESTTVMPTTNIVTTEDTNPLIFKPTTTVIREEETDSTLVMSTTKITTTEAIEPETLLLTTTETTMLVASFTTAMPTPNLITAEDTEPTTSMSTTEIFTTQEVDSTTVMPTTKVTAEAFYSTTGTKVAAEETESTTALPTTLKFTTEKVDSTPLFPALTKFTTEETKSPNGLITTNVNSIETADSTTVISTAAIISTAAVDSIKKTPRTTLHPLETKRFKTVLLTTAVVKAEGSGPPKTKLTQDRKVTRSQTKTSNTSAEKTEETFTQVLKEIISTTTRKGMINTKRSDTKSTNDFLSGQRFFGVVTGGLVVGFLLIIVVAGIVGLCSHRRESRKKDGAMYAVPKDERALDDRSRTSSSESNWREIDYVMTFPTVNTPDYMNSSAAGEETDSPHGIENQWKFYNGAKEQKGADMKTPYSSYSHVEYSYPQNKPLTTFSTASGFHHYHETRIQTASDLEDSLDSIDENAILRRPKTNGYSSTVYRPPSDGSDTGSVYSIPRPSVRDPREKKRRPSVAFVNPLYST